MSIRYFIPILFGITLSCASVQHMADQTPQRTQISDSLADDLAIEDLIKPYRQKVSFEMDQVIGLAAMNLTKQPVESTLGNWVADAVLTEAKVTTQVEYDFAICNYGGIRILNIPAGPVRKGKIYELMPFDNYLVTMKLPGTVVRQLFDHMAGRNGWPISKEVKYKIKDRRATEITIGGAPIDDAATYRIVLSDYLAEGGGDCHFLKEFPYENLNMYYRDALVQYTMAQQAGGRSLSSVIEGRVISLDQEN